MKIIRKPDRAFEYTYIYPNGRQERRNIVPMGASSRRLIKNIKFVDVEENREVYFAEIHYYGFYLRFAKKTFIPCSKCQEEIQKILDCNPIRIVEGSQRVTMHYSSGSAFKDNNYFFVFRFLRHDPTFRPCTACQARLKALLEEAELIIGNEDYEPMIEFYRKWRPLETESRFQ